MAHTRTLAITYPPDATVLEKITLNWKSIKKLYNLDVIENEVLKSLPKLPNTDEAVTTRTQSVSARLCKRIKALGIGMGAPVKITIQPLLLRNCCHWNCTFMRDLFPRDLEIVIGYNLTACPCGALYFLEFHSVLRTVDEVYVDFTTDHMGETEKWFVPLFVLDDGHEILNVVRTARSAGSVGIEMFSNQATHVCALPRGHLTFAFGGLTSTNALYEHVQTLRALYGKP
jgi:hypothetical protein